jgi:hypothetical protein
VKVVINKIPLTPNGLIKNFSMALYSLHEKEYNDHAENAFTFMMQTYATYHSMPLVAAWCDLHDLRVIHDKEVVLDHLQSSLNLVCKFAFPVACKTCGNLLDNILRTLEFEPGQIHQVLVALPKFDEDLLFQRSNPLPVEENPKESAQTPITTKV